MISFYAGNFSDIASDPVQESGERILFAEDSGDLFLERSGTRIRIQDVIRIDTESEREAILAPLDKIYFVTESRKLWSYISGNWFLLNEEGENPSGDFFGEDPFLVRNSPDTLLLKSGTSLLVDGSVYTASEDFEIDIGESLDSGTISPGKDYCVYLTSDETFVVSLNTTFPTGTLSDGSTAFNADNTRKIGGFHALCEDVGEIEGHPLSGFSAGEILPASVWCLNHRPYSEAAGMVYCEALDFWVDIYLQSGTGTETASVLGGTITDTRCYPDHVQDMFSVRKQLLSDNEFSAVAEGSNQGTSLSGASDPVTTGGHKDTNNRRMISNIGCEDTCGAMWQWLNDCGPCGGSGAYTIPGNQGYAYGTLYTLTAGGRWENNIGCGSRARAATSSYRVLNSGVSARGMSRSRRKERC